MATHNAERFTIGSADDAPYPLVIIDRQSGTIVINPRLKLSDLSPDMRETLRELLRYYGSDYGTA